MTWRIRPNGDLDLSVLRSLETALSPDGIIALRLEHERVRGELEAEQFALSPDDAEAWGRELIQVAQLARAAKGQA